MNAPLPQDFPRLHDGPAGESFPLSLGDLKDMARYEAPRFSKKRVNQAGRDLLSGKGEVWEWLETLEIINNWRSIHGFPLNTFQTTLRNKGRIVDPDVIVAQRIKRLSSIELKLRRFPTMTLSQMQDIGGCRAIVSSVDDVVRLVKSYLQSDIKHKLHTQDNYLGNPKPTGYRGFHLIYSYFSDRVPTYNGLKIEMQIRSQPQHAWATAVEIVGTFTRQALKSSQGEDDWLRFFALMGSALAHREGTVRVPDTPDDKTRLVEELNIVSERIDAVGRLRHYGMAPNILEHPEARDDHFFLLQLDTSISQLDVKGYKLSDIGIASADYLEAEKDIGDSLSRDAVLVSVDSLSSLRKAYPNYFLDTKLFVELVNDALAGKLNG
jgi:hypothetical protein